MVKKTSKPKKSTEAESDLGKRVLQIAGWLLWIAAAYFLASFIMAVLIIIFRHYGLIDIENPGTVVNFLINASMYVLMFVIAMWLPIRRWKESRKEKIDKVTLKNFVFDQVGLSRRLKWVDLRYFIADLPMFYFVNIFISMLAAYWLGSEIMGQEQSLGFEATSNAWWQLVIIFLALVVIAPLFEEMLMRGFLFKKIRKSAPFWVTAILISLLFAVAHGQVNVGIMTFIMSMFCCWIREKTGTIWGAIFLHATSNFVAFALLFLFN